MHVPRCLRPLLLAAGLAAAALAVSACAMKPAEIQRIETENQLLREQIQSMRLECEQYRKIDIGVDEPKSATPESETPAPAPPP